ncbi:MAG: serine/threonine-protein kinase [Nanoarchaeota archaeon]|nr:serine/threonine-protein kinase [Nanoarchaeota archaeon]
MEFYEKGIKSYNPQLRSSSSSALSTLFRHGFINKERYLKEYEENVNSKRFEPVLDTLNGFWGLILKHKINSEIALKGLEISLNSIYEPVVNSSAKYHLISMYESGILNKRQTLSVFNSIKKTKNEKIIKIVEESLEPLINGKLRRERNIEKKEKKGKNKVNQIRKVLEKIMGEFLEFQEEFSSVIMNRNRDSQFISDYLSSNYVKRKNGQYRSQNVISKELKKLIQNPNLDYDRLSKILHKQKARNLNEIIECSQLDSRHELFLKKEGSGVEGRVFLVDTNRYKKEGELAAAKVYDEEPEFTTEASILRELRHKNIVQIYNAGRDWLKVGEKEVYAVLEEHVEGESLETIILASEKLDEEVALNYSAQLFDGLAYLRENKIYHRDISPKNIKVDLEGNLKILDFGIATENLSAEYVEKRRYGGETDIFSWGLITYKMLTGKDLILNKETEISSNSFINKYVELKGKMRNKDGSLRYNYVQEIGENIKSENMRNAIILSLENSNEINIEKRYLSVQKNMNLLRINFERKDEIEKIIRKNNPRFEELSGQDYFDLMKIIG